MSAFADLFKPGSWEGPLSWAFESWSNDDECAAAFFCSTHCCGRQRAFNGKTQAKMHSDEQRS